MVVNVVSNSCAMSDNITEYYWAETKTIRYQLPGRFKLHEVSAGKKLVRPHRGQRRWVQTRQAASCAYQLSTIFCLVNKFDTPITTRPSQPSLAPLQVVSVSNQLWPLDLILARMPGDRVMKILKVVSGCLGLCLC